VARRWRVAIDTAPCSRNSASTASYCDGETTTATESRFFAAARMSVGPPMSMFSMIVSSSAPLASVSENGYSDDTTRSIGSKRLSASWRMCSGLSRRARMPAWIAG
jgi:hypothetical protein